MKKSCPNRNHCELCGEEASLYCDADSAFLCFGCDRRVHAANFLVARHVRRLTCPSCHSLTGSGHSATLSGSGSGSDPTLPLIRPLCSSCSPDEPPSSASSSCLSSDDESTSTLPPPPRKRWAGGCMKRTIAHWSRRIGMEGVAGVAAHVLRACSVGGGEMAVMPPRASLAAAILYAAKICFCSRGGDRVCGEVLRRLERCSGVPAELILAAESRIARAVRTRARADAEGWADSECS